MDNINAAISFIEAAKDENQALRRVVRRVAEVRQFYVSKQHYRLDDEFLFEDKVNEFKLAEPGRKPQLAKEMEQLVLNFCFSKDSDLLKKSSETSDLYWVLRDVASLKEAVARSDEKMASLYLNNIWPEKVGSSMEENYFRRTLATLSGTDLWKLEQFEKHLLSAITCRSHPRWLESEGQSHAEQLDDLGLDITKEYVETQESYVRIPWLTDFLAILLLDGLLKAVGLHLRRPGYRFRFGLQWRASGWVAGLTLLRDEIACCAYNANEMIRRLRQHEDSDGAYAMPSLIYRLLETQAGRT